MSKKEKKQDSLESVLKEYRSITLDLEASIDDDNPAKHELEIDYNIKRLKENNDRYDILVSGSGTGED